jgi:8-oxo-dGTP pyrophosphatase MutT (NUDIX family)
MGYIEDLRESVGSRPIVMVGAGVILLDEQGRILLHHRTDNDTWSIPGGSLEPGETLEETARRETYEEIGLTVGEMHLFHVFSGPALYYRYPNGDEVYNVSVVFVSRDWHGDLSAGESAESSGVQFFPLDDLPRSISPPVRPVLESFTKTQRKS